MKKWIVFALTVLLLAGCGDHVQPTQPSTTAPEQTEVVTSPVTVTEPLAEITAYPLESGSYSAVGTVGNRVLLMGDESIRFPQSKNGGTELQVAVPEGAKVLRITQDRVVCLWGSDVVILNENLQEIRRVSLSESVMGEPTISADMNTVYYCVPQGLRAMDISTGITRLVKEYSCQDQTICALVFADTVLVCRVEEMDGDSYLSFISVENGQTLATSDRVRQFFSEDDRYFYFQTEGSVEKWVFGELDGQNRLFAPGEKDSLCFPLLQRNAVMTAEYIADIGMAVKLYDLEMGNRIVTTVLPGLQAVTDVSCSGDAVWVLGSDSDGADLLLRWDVSQSAQAEIAGYITQNYTYESPDVDGLARCQELAERIGREYDVQIAIRPEDFVQPEDYTLTHEYLVQPLEEALECLENMLAKFPEGMLKKMAEVTDDGVFHINLVRQISNDERRLQYWVDGKAYIAVSLGDRFEEDCYHGLCHAMETFIYSNTSYFDTWSTNNPKKFSYDFSYELYGSRTDTAYLEGEDRGFIDAFSMTYPKEDRAQFFAFGMMDGCEEYFASPVMQAKLEHLCKAIRDAMRWNKETGEYPWEQYLEESLAYTKKKK